MLEVWIYSLVSVFAVSLISFAGIFSLAIKPEKLNNFLIYLVSFSAGALFGGAFLHLLPEVVKNTDFQQNTYLLILSGIVVFFIVEKFISWHHCHQPITKNHVHSFAYMNLVGDGVHNFIDGTVIASAYLINIQTGIAATLAVIFHEIPQEIGEFGILIYGGFSRLKALVLNFASGLVAILGAIAALSLSKFVPNIESFLVPIAIGGFIYIAGTDLIPELHKEKELKKSFWQLVCFVLGILLMKSLILFE